MLELIAILKLFILIHKIFYKNKGTANQDRYQPDAGLLSKIIEKVEKNENPKEIELRVIYKLIFNFPEMDENSKLSIRLVDLCFVKDLNQFRFLLKYCEFRGNRWGSFQKMLRSLW